MNSFSDIFGYIASEISRVSVLLQIATFALALISWLVLTKLFALENRRWPLEKRFKYITTFKQLANELLLLFVLRAFTLVLDSITHVAGLLFFVSGFYGLCLFSRFFIVFLKFFIRN